MYQWDPLNGPVRDSLAKQSKATQVEFEKRCADSMLALTE
jgi:hypothetical protein